MKGQVEISTVELVAARLEREAEPGVVSGRLESFHDHRCDSVPANHNVTYAGGSPPPIGLEEALDLTGFGRFSVKLVLGLWLCMTTQNFTGTDIAYSLPAAQCDLQFTAMEKGWVNAALYVGMMSTAFVWGALSDRVGRKYPLVLSYAAMAVCSFINAMFVSTAWAFLVCRVFMGAMLIATATLSMTYAGELFGKTYRARVFMWGGTLQAFSAAGHAGLAMWIIPLQLSWLRSWRVFMLLTTLINAVTGLFLLLLPESPKSLAVRGRQRESIGVLASIFSSNTGLPADCYPVRSLTLPKSLQDSANEGNPFAVMGRQFVKLCRPPYRIPLLFAVIVQPLILYCQNTIRMWVPTIFAEMERDLASGLTQSRAVCNILEDMSPAAANVTTYTNCEAFHVDSSVYLNSAIIMLARAGFQLTAGFTIQTLGRKICLVSTLTLATSTLIAWPFAASSSVVLMIACFFEGLANVAFTTLMNITVDLFPTSVRSSAVSLANFSGRAGSMVGNIAFPLLLAFNCSLAFWTGAGLLAFAAFLSVFKPRPSFTPIPNTGMGAKMLAEQRASMASMTTVTSATTIDGCQAPK
ncbi:synaptic vesicle glycoprotein 2C-like isoform X1 [Frankliniella occidentalis]|uniref:Synaptic vesicle glycoprotein 2C-like isoform X1 n=1 Tax=Frankliniella occidentalis TaxID=133901 RepID=A0A6J1SUG8_FRAOC|nr:synaptic vesicle glycoprotein 2C-like isoform X1 [Frankliniella occidentalis]